MIVTILSAIRKTFFIFAFLFFSVISEAQTFVVLDDFDNGTVTADSVKSMAGWKIFDGSFTVATTYVGHEYFGKRTKSLIATGSNNRLSTSFNKVCNAWEFEIDPESTTSGQFDAYFFFMTSASPDPGFASGYYVVYDHSNYTVSLRRMDNGVVARTIISYSKGSFGSANPFKVRVTRDVNTWKLFVDNLNANGTSSTTERGSGEDDTYAQNACAYQGVYFNLSSTLLNSDAIDNIKYVEIAGCVPGAQEICGNRIDDDCDGLIDNVYRFTGDGNFSVASNWECSTVPPNPLPANNHVIITPQANGRCNLDIQYTVSSGAKFTVSEGKELVLPTNLIIQ